MSENYDDRQDIEQLQQALERLERLIVSAEDTIRQSREQAETIRRHLAEHMWNRIE